MLLSIKTAKLSSCHKLLKKGWTSLISKKWFVQPFFRFSYPRLVERQLDGQLSFVDLAFFHDREGEIVLLQHMLHRAAASRKDRFNSLQAFGAGYRN